LRGWLLRLWPIIKLVVLKSYEALRHPQVLEGL